MSRYRLAQLNIARTKAPLTSAVMADFVANLDRINALAEASPGFVWRLKEEAGSATDSQPFGDDVVVNLSVWKDVAALSDYAYRSAHADILRRRREWFHPMAQAHAVLWWVEKDHRPTVEEAREHLEWLRRHGATPRAFTFREAFSAPDAGGRPQAIVPENACPAG